MAKLSLAIKNTDAEAYAAACRQLADGCNSCHPRASMSGAMWSSSPTHPRSSTRISGVQAFRCPSL